LPGIPGVLAEAAPQSLEAVLKFMSVFSVIDESY
jgi:hypothetical protein